MDDSDIINNFIPCEICNELILFSEYHEHIKTSCGLISNSLNSIGSCDGVLFISSMYGMLLILILVV